MNKKLVVLAALVFGVIGLTLAKAQDNAADNSAMNSDTTMNADNSAMNNAT